VKLLDRIAQCAAPVLVAGTHGIARLPGAGAYATAIAACPLRLVLTEPLTRVCASLAYADGDRLTGCLDLIHVPATRLWVEWPDRPRREAVAAALQFPDAGCDEVLRAGVYLTTDATGRHGTARTFWGATAADAEPRLAPLVTQFDLDLPHDGDGAAPRSVAEVFDGASAWIHSDEPTLAGLMRCLRFRFDPAWAAYYRAECATAALRAAVLNESLATVGTDLPVVFALCLLLSSRMRLPVRRPDLRRLNRRRARAGSPALLDHVEVSAPVMSAYRVDGARDGDARRTPRLHHVRGHLVRRGNQVFWRVPHLRGRAAFGNLRARSVTLLFEPRATAPRAGRSDAYGAEVARPQRAPLPFGGPP
jgi:hypothetical protein